MTSSDLPPGRSLDWIDGALVIVDQTRLPATVTTLRLTTTEEVVDAIRRLSVRGAPAIGVAGAYGVAVAVAEHGRSGDALDAAVAAIRTARPTAVNLARMVDRVAPLAAGGVDAVVAEATAIRDEELAASIAMGDLGADLVTELVGTDPVRAMTVCNTGGLAAVERGTALAVIQTLHERGHWPRLFPSRPGPCSRGRG